MPVDPLFHLSAEVVDAPATDMQDFEQAADRCVCHLFEYSPTNGSQRSFCGATTRDEQPRHPYPPGTPRSALTDPYCHCGLPRCAACAVVEARHAA